MIGLVHVVPDILQRALGGKQREVLARIRADIGLRARGGGGNELGRYNRRIQGCRRLRLEGDGLTGLLLEQLNHLIEGIDMGLPEHAPHRPGRFKACCGYRGRYSRGGGLDTNV